MRLWGTCIVRIPADRRTDDEKSDGRADEKAGDESARRRILDWGTTVGYHKCLMNHHEKGHHANRNVFGRQVEPLQRGIVIDFRSMRSLAVLNQSITECRKCPRLVDHREAIARMKRKQYRDWMYWGRPVPAFGDPSARLFIIGLAPAAHGGNRTGRIFTGDRSGDWLYEALHRYGFANQPHSIHKDDGLALKDCYIAAVVRCAPPDNKPTPDEFDCCRPYLIEELRLLKKVQVIVTLGKIAFDQYLKACRELGHDLPSPALRFGHGVIYRLSWGATLIGSYHPSQQNTFTGKLTTSMFHGVFERARAVLSDASEGGNVDEGADLHTPRRSRPPGQRINLGGGRSSRRGTS